MLYVKLEERKKDAPLSHLGDNPVVVACTCYTGVCGCEQRPVHSRLKQFEAWNLDQGEHSRDWTTSASPV